MLNEFKEKTKECAIPVALTLLCSVGAGCYLHSQEQYRRDTIERNVNIHKESAKVIQQGLNDVYRLKEVKDLQTGNVVYEVEGKNGDFLEYFGL